MSSSPKSRPRVKCPANERPSAAALIPAVQGYFSMTSVFGGTRS
jgi:hypothetical protein